MRLVSDIQGVQWKPSPHSWQGVNAKETERERGVGDLFIQWGHIKDQHVIYIHINPSDYFIFIFRASFYLLGLECMMYKDKKPTCIN